MEKCESEAIAAFDTLYTNNHIQILKVLLPYFDPSKQKNLILLIKYMELQYAWDYCSRHPKALHAASCEPDGKDQHKKKPDMIQLFSQIKNFCSPSERTMFEQLANMKRAMEMYEEMSALMQLYGEFAPDTELSGKAPSASMGQNPLELLKGMLSPEQQAMFDMFQSGFAAGSPINPDSAGCSPIQKENENQNLKGAPDV